MHLMTLLVSVTSANNIEHPLVYNNNNNNEF